MTLSDADDVAGLLDGRIGGDLPHAVLRLPPQLLDFTCPKMWIWLPEPWVMWMCPEPVDTVSSTRPLTVRLRSKVASAASAGSRCQRTAEIAVLSQDVSSLFLDSKTVSVIEF